MDLTEFDDGKQLTSIHCTSCMREDFQLIPNWDFVFPLFLLESLRSTTRPALLRGLNFRSGMPANNLIKVIHVWSLFK